MRWVFDRTSICLNQIADPAHLGKSTSILEITARASNSVMLATICCTAESSLESVPIFTSGVIIFHRH